MTNTQLYGELLHAYGYDIAPGTKQYEALNYYTNEMITIPLDPTLSASENAQHYFNKYNKLKRTFEALTTQVAETKADIDQLESICTFMDLALIGGRSGSSRERAYRCRIHPPQIYRETDKDYLTPVPLRLL